MKTVLHKRELYNLREIVDTTDDSSASFVFGDSAKSVDILKKQSTIFISFLSVAFCSKKNLFSKTKLILSWQPVSNLLIVPS